MGQHDALRRALGARGEEHRRLGRRARRRAGPAARSTSATSLSKRVTAACRSSVQSSGEARRLDRLHQLAEPGLLDEAAAREHRRAAGGAERRQHRSRAHGRVDHRRDPARAPEGEQHRDRRPAPPGSSRPTRSPGGEARPERALEHGAGEGQLAIGQLSPSMSSKATRAAPCARRAARIASGSDPNGATPRSEPVPPRVPPVPAREPDRSARSFPKTRALESVSRGRCRAAAARWRSPRPRTGSSPRRRSSATAGCRRPGRARRRRPARRRRCRRRRRTRFWRMLRSVACASRRARTRPARSP